MSPNVSLISFCGLYCGECPSYKKQKCPGCAQNVKASWCKVRNCCLEKGLESCAGCDEFSDVKECKKHNNLISKMFGLFLNSDRRKGIEFIKDNGYQEFASYMVSLGRVSMRRR